MAKSLGSFRAALLIGWGVLGLAGIWYARAKGIPGLTALPVVAAFCIEYSFYLVPAFPTLRERFAGARLIAFALLAALLPYLACCCGAISFEWGSFIRVAAVAMALSLWYVVLRPSMVSDVLFLALVAAVLLLKYFNPIFVPADAHFKDLKNIIVIPHLSLISIAVMVLMVERRVPDAGYGFVPSAREWRIGLLNFLYFIPAGLPLALLLRATHFAAPKPLLQVAMTFVGTLWVVALSEDFFLFGVLQKWIGEWSSSGQVAILATAAVFGLLHLWFGGSPNFPNWKWALVAGVLGWFCGRARNQAGSIRASMVTHALVATTWRAFFA